MHQNATMSPNSAPIPINHGQAGHTIAINSHHQQQQQPHHHHQQQQHHHQQQQAQIMGPIVSSGSMTTSQQAPGNQTTATHIHQPTTATQQQTQSQPQQQKTQILPLLLSPRLPSLTPNSSDQIEPSENDHDQIIDQVISLENEYSDTSGMLASVDTSTGILLGNQQQHNQLGDINISSGICNIPESNQFSSSSEDLLNLLLEFDREPSNLIGLGNSQQLDQDEKVGIENIRKQLMSCEVQSDQSQQNQNTNSMSPIVNQMTYQPQQQARTTQQQSCSNVHQQQRVTQQLVSQTAPVISHHQQQQSHQMSTPIPSQQHQVSADQSMIHGSYSNVPISTVPVSSSGQSYASQQQSQQSQQQQQHVSNRISQTNSLAITSNSPSPSWQPPQLSPLYSPQNLHNDPRTPSQRQGQQHHTIHQQQQQHPMQQLHHPLQQRSPSQSVSPPATTEPSPVVKKNPLLNAQLINSRAPSITPTRFMNSQANVLNQNPILNAKLSQSSYVTNNSGSIVGTSPVNPSLNPQSRFIPQNQQPSNFNFDMTQQQQSTNQTIFRTTPTSVGSINSSCGAPMNMGNTSPSGGITSQQMKQEIRRKVQPKQQHQTTSLLKQLLSDDNK